MSAAASNPGKMTLGSFRCTYAIPFREQLLRVCVYHRPRSTRPQGTSVAESSTCILRFRLSLVLPVKEPDVPPRRADHFIMHPFFIPFLRQGQSCVNVRRPHPGEDPRA